MNPQTDTTQDQEITREVKSMRYAALVKLHSERGQTTLFHTIGTAGNCLTLEAAALDPACLMLDAALNIEAAAPGSSTPQPATFSMLAYSGGPLRLDGWQDPVIIDTQGMATRQDIPVRLNGSTAADLGHTTKVDTSCGRVTAEGALSRATECAREVAISAANGFPWRATVACRMIEAQHVAAGKAFSVNGQAFTGPAYMVTQSELFAVSIQDMTPDSGTTVEVSQARG